MLSCTFCKVIIFDENYFARFRCLCMTLVDVTTRREFFLHPVFMKKRITIFFCERNFKFVFGVKGRFKLHAETSGFCSCHL